jgi:predicted ATPase/class 3 adenylate cyclase
MRNLIPHLIIENYRKEKWQNSFEAVTMFVDIAGFTDMTQSLMENGKEGAEILTEIINRIFTPSIEVIYENEGFISTFAGDAFTTIFPLDKISPQQALDVAVQVQKQFCSWKIQKTKFGNYQLELKIGISLGEVEWQIINATKFSHYFFRGAAIHQAALSEKHCKNGKIVFDENIKKQIETNAKKSRDGYYQIDSIKEPCKQIERKTVSRLELSEESLRQFLPNVIMELETLGEFRYVISCFISFEESDDFATQLEKIMNLTEEYGGYFNKIDYGDKGYVILVLFGAPIAQEKMAIRSCDFALAVERISDFKCRIGLSFGIAFTGFVGSEQRAEYTALGMSVNRAARFMMQAAWQEIYLDEKIVQGNEEFYRFDFINNIKLKGFTEPIPVYKLWKKKTTQLPQFTGEFINREEEKQQMLDMLENGKTKFGGFLYIDGTAGIGKTRFIYEIMKANQKEWQWIFWPCDEILKKSFNSIKHFLIRFFQQSEEKTQDENKVIFENLYDDLFNQIDNQELKEEFSRVQSFLGALINLYWNDSLFEQLDAKSRYENMVNSVQVLIKILAKQKPLIVVLEDVNGIDEDTIQVLQTFTIGCEQLPITFILASRLNDDFSTFILPLPQDLSSRLMLQPLSVENRNKLITSILLQQSQIEKVPENTAQLILEKSEGNPFFIEQTIYYLRESKLLNEKLEVTQQVIDIPADINSLIVSRIDKLKPDLKRITKIASVLGKKFTNKVISLMIKESQIDKYILDGVEENLWYSLSQMDNMFKNGFIRESVYQLILKKELRQLHKLAGESIETLYEGNLKEYYADLAYNFQAAEWWDKAIYYLEKAGDYAKELYELSASLDFYNQLLHVLGKLSLNTEYQHLLMRTKINRIEVMLFQGDTISAENELQEIAPGFIETEYEKDKFYFLKAQTLTLREQHVAMKEFYENNIQEIKTDYFRNYLMIFYLDTLRFLNEQVTFLQHANFFLQTVKKTEDSFFESRLYNLFGMYHLQRAEYPPAMDFFEKNYAIVKEKNNKILMRSALNNIGIVHSRLGHKDEAVEYYKKSLKIAEEIGKKDASCKALSNIATILSVQGKAHEAISYFEKALKTAKTMGNKMQQGIILYGIAEVLSRNGENEKAIDYVTQSKTICQEISDIVGITYANDMLGDIYFTLSDFETALQLYEENIKLQEQLNDKEGIAHTLGNLGNLAKAAKNYEKAIEYYAKQQSMSHTIGDKQGEGNAYFNWAMAEYETNHLENAIDKLQKSLVLFEQCSVKMGIDLCREQLLELEKKLEESKQ